MIKAEIKATDIDCAYAAGLFDGEGTIMSTQRVKRGSIKVIVTNTDYRLCEFVRERWGGKVYSESKSNPRHKTVYRWWACGDRSQAFLEAVKPYSIVKSRLIILALNAIPMAWQRNMGDSRQHIISTINSINQGRA